MINGSLVCLCNHLSSFGGDFFVAPNPIDFDQVWLAMKNIGETQNFVVLSTLCTIFAIYFIAVVFARREDKNDELKVGISNNTKSTFLLTSLSSSSICGQNEAKLCGDNCINVQNNIIPNPISVIYYDIFTKKSTTS